jgi:hypothetical protein
MVRRRKPRPSVVIQARGSVVGQDRAAKVPAKRHVMVFDRSTRVPSAYLRLCMWYPLKLDQRETYSIWPSSRPTLFQMASTDVSMLAILLAGWLNAFLSLRQSSSMETDGKPNRMTGAVHPHLHRHQQPRPGWFCVLRMKMETPWTL